jgi:hypothetical protein
VGFGPVAGGFDRPALEGRRIWSEAMPRLASKPKRFVVPDSGPASWPAPVDRDDGDVVTAGTAR